MFTMGQAAKEAGVSRATLRRAIESGKVSAYKTNKDGWDIDLAELFRVYPPNTRYGSRNGAMKQTATPAETPPDTAALQAEIDGLRELLDDMMAALERERKQVDRWQKQAESLRLLADQRPRWGWFGLGKAG
jgi:hypothetical protein